MPPTAAAAAKLAPLRQSPMPSRGNATPGLDLTSPEASTSPGAAGGGGMPMMKSSNLTTSGLQLIASPGDRRLPPPLTFPGASPNKGLRQSSSSLGALNGLDELHAKLRKDVLRMQQIIDALGNRNSLSFESRKVEAEVLRSSHEPNAEDRMTALLLILERKASEFAVAVTGRPEQQEPSATNRGLLTAMLDAILTNPQLPQSAVMSITKAAASAPAPPADALEATAKPAPQQSAAATVLSDATRSRLVELGCTIEDDTPLSDVIEAFEAIVKQHKAPHHHHHKHATFQHTPPPSQLQPASSAEAPRSPSTAAVALPSPPPPASPSALRESAALLQQQSGMEIDALRARLAARELELNELRHHVSASRYSNNQPRTLTTVHDAPMSYEVERQYQREMHRLADRVKELEANVQSLYEAGASDRQAVVDLTDEVAGLKREIQGYELRVEGLRRERDEQHDLFTGVTKARGEEARMSLVAVRQLESRVATLTEQLKAKTDEAANLEVNLERMWDAWNTADSELVRVTSELGEMKDLFEAFGTVYNDFMAQSLEEALREVHRLGRLSDDQIALTTIQKQRLEDAEMLRALTVSEQQIWMERLKSSTEWKMLSVKSPEETKQLAVRLLMLTGEKEKKEMTMTTSHAERLNLYKARAEREVSERQERREVTMPILDAASARQRWGSEEQDISQRYSKEREDIAKSGQGGRVTKLRYTDIKPLYMTEARKRPVEFRVLFNDEVEAKAATEAQS